MMKFDKILRNIAVVTTLFTAASAMGQTVEEARQLAEDGNIAGAITLLRNVVAENPKNIEAAVELGVLLYDSGHDAEAEEVLQKARKQGNRDATFALARIALGKYDIDEGRALLAAYRKTLRSGKKVVAEDQSENLEDQFDRAERMLDRVQNIEVIDSVDVDAEDFFRHYPLSSAAGKLVGSDALPAGFPSDDQTVVHVTGSGNRMVWAAQDSEGVSRLYGSSALLDNEWEAPEALGEELGEGGDAVYPYMMPDGVTLYFANDGENSLGGYDIFLTRKGDDGYLQPANVGMPFNSPYNDYLLAIDEYTGAGWFVTDRNRHPGKVTIYTFVPQELRVNVDIDDPRLTSLARLDNIALTRKEGKDYSAILRAVEEGRNMGDDAPKTPDFTLSVPGRGVYTALDDFKSRAARDAMKEYLVKQKKLYGIINRLTDLRESYTRGDWSQRELINTLETGLDDARAELKALRSKVIKLETGK